MKTLNITFEDEEYSVLKMRKDMSGKNWHDFIIWSASVANMQTISLEMPEQTATIEIPERVEHCITCSRNATCESSQDYMMEEGECPLRYKPR